jgi:membrane protein YqaA with SNARE-associated domain
VQTEARRLMPHTIQGGHVVGPFTGLAVDEVDDAATLEQRRKALEAEKASRRQRRAALEASRGQVWRVASRRRRFEGRLLRSFEVREDAALVDQVMHSFRYDDEGGRPVSDGYWVSTAFQRDERFWSSVIRRERAFMRAFVRPQEAFVARLVGPQRRFLETWKSYRRTLARRRPLAAALLTVAVLPAWILVALLVKTQELIFFGTVQIQKTIADRSVDLPVMVKEGARDTRLEFATPAGRQGIIRALLDETYLTPERRRVILFLAALFLVLSWFFAELLIRFTYPEALEAKKTTDIVFFYAIATRLFLPTPLEFILIDSTFVIGLWPAVIMASAGAMVGSWILFLVGGEASKGIQKLIENNRAMKAGFLWLEHNARKFGSGYFILGFFLAIPLAPETPPTFLAALLRLQMKWFLLTIFVATTLRSLLSVYALDYFSKFF